MHAACRPLKALAFAALTVAASVDATPLGEASATTVPINNTACTTRRDMDRVGFNLTSVHGGVSSCDDACRANSACVTWSWSNYDSYNYQDGTCWLKSHNGPQVSKVGASFTECTFHESQVCLPYKNYDIVGMDIGNKLGASVDSCCDICNEFSGCKAYSWNDYNGGTCWLKSDIGQVETKAGVTSSTIVVRDTGVCSVEYNVDYEGNDIGNKPAADAGVCCSTCQANKECKAYTWSNYNGGTCWMKSGKGNAVAKNGVTSATIITL